MDNDLTPQFMIIRLKKPEMKNIRMLNLKMILKLNAQNNIYLNTKYSLILSIL